MHDALWQGCSMPLTLENCEDLQQLNKGRYSTISKAWCPALGGCIVIKCYDKASRKQQRLAQREASMLKCLNAAGVPNITRLWSSYEDHLHHYLLMEYCSHGNLLELLQANGPCTEHWVATAIAAPMLATLAYMQSLGVYHRDVKLENIFLATGNRLRLGDYELAVWEHEPPARAPVGTVFYMAPEMLILSGPAVDIGDGCKNRQGRTGWSARQGTGAVDSGCSKAAPHGSVGSCSNSSSGGRGPHKQCRSTSCDRDQAEAAAEAADCSTFANCNGSSQNGCHGPPSSGSPCLPAPSAKVDVWSLGVCLYELVAGYKPFQGSSCEAIASSILAGEPAALPQHVSPEFRDLIAHMMCMDPAQRPSARELLHHPWITEHVRHAGKRADSCSSMEEWAGNGQPGKLQQDLSEHSRSGVSVSEVAPLSPLVQQQMHLPAVMQHLTQQHLAAHASGGALSQSVCSAKEHVQQASVMPHQHAAGPGEKECCHAAATGPATRAPQRAARQQWLAVGQQQLATVAVCARWLLQQLLCLIRHLSVPARP